MTGQRVRAAAAIFAISMVVLTGCSSGGSDASTSSTTSTSAVTSTTAATTSTSTDPSTSTTSGGGTAPASTTTIPKDAPVTTTSTTAPKGGLKPGDPCSTEEGVPDCVDPDGDGEGVYLTDGAACMAVHPDPSMCADLDGDGVAGYPDSE